jgi:uncharacterized protein YdhG (YjbR/CyaY superfamily)
MLKTPPKTMDAYIKSFPSDIYKILEKIRQTIQKSAPKAEETISYGMPAFKLNSKILVFFAAWQHHIGFYATPSGNTAFKKEIAKYKTSKGAIQFPLDETVPFKLIREIVRFRVREVEKLKK